ncbi:MULTISPECIES: GNAT family N-acetyltransferase [Halobacterium]|uniref:GNAT family acetyltransferase n=5 Tax=Halobacterium salinarum TaxID=2242 RepID=Q9HRK6_HALSA|nr:MULTISPECIES: GNAT family N-acetyltransferase [Halobacterium]AAG19152.1 conserved hypothetical protein [Halobacterium salinarum NRC-1]MBB6089994.1 ribosomal protein S18 acetylase RimI-like enzyme [Halobacterium salinarum]MDL0120710.1 GNAT family N-acetyltransferase [Halobacterium salinarum]MDL0121338.1 GNAT family N-acetyltransferase [Halobacterium salinarum]MDL0123943.1 GNAT family N-acetyltransferase [Halobacterium salinarum]
MIVREATHADGDAVRAVANASLEASYADPLGDDIVHTAATEWYDSDRLADRLDTDAVQYLVAERDDAVVGFSESERDGDVAAIQWLHVHPDARGDGVGGSLLSDTETHLLEHGASRIEGRVLAANEPGNDFYQAHGYARSGTRELAIRDDTHTEHLYVKLPAAASTAAMTERRETTVGDLWVALDERERGSDAPFYAAYRDADRETKYGFYCAACEHADTAMNTMGRVACNNCGNERRETRWDAAYL